MMGREPYCQANVIRPGCSAREQQKRTLKIGDTKMCAISWSCSSETAASRDRTYAGCPIGVSTPNKNPLGLTFELLLLELRHPLGLVRSFRHGP